MPPWTYSSKSASAGSLIGERNERSPLNVFGRGRQGGVQAGWRPAAHQTHPSFLFALYTWPYVPLPTLHPSYSNRSSTRSLSPVSFTLKSWSIFTTVWPEVSALLPLSKRRFGRQLFSSDELGSVFQLVAFSSVAISSFNPASTSSCRGKCGDARWTELVHGAASSNKCCFNLLLRFSQPVSAPKRRTSLGNDDVFMHGTVGKRRKNRPCSCGVNVGSSPGSGSYGRLFES